MRQTTDEMSLSRVKVDNALLCPPGDNQHVIKNSNIILWITIRVGAMNNIAPIP